MIRDSEKERKTAEGIGGGDGAEEEEEEKEVEEELGQVGMGGWLNFSSDHVEPIKADHGTQPPPPTSSTFFVLSLFPPRMLAFIHPLSAPPPSLLPASPRERERAFSFSDVPSSVSLPPARRAIRRPPPPSRRRAAPRPPSISSSFSCHPRPLTHSLATRWIFSRHEAV